MSYKKTTAAVTAVTLAMTGLVYYPSDYTAEGLYSVIRADESETADGFIYRMEEDGSAVITGYNGKGKKLIIPELIGDITVKGIDRYAFAERDISEVILPDTLKTIGVGAFEFCKSLKNVYLNDGLEVIEDSAFSESALESVSISESLNTACHPFIKCDELKTFELRGKRHSIPSQLFEGCTGLEEVVIPENISEIGNEAFSKCINLRKIKLSEGLEIIGEMAFDGCSSLNAAAMPSTLITIMKGAFKNCSGLEELRLNDGLQVMDDGAFSGTAISYVNIPSSASEVWYPFMGCRKLKRVEFTGEPEYINAHILAGCTGLEEVVVPEGVTAVFKGAFSECINLKKVSLPSTLESIGESAFSGCEELTSLTLPESMKMIEHAAFSGCTALAEIKMEEGIEKIGPGVFTGCEKLKIYGKENSYAHKYAVENSLEFSDINTYSESPQPAVTESTSAVPPSDTESYNGTFNERCVPGQIKLYTLVSPVEKIENSNPAVALVSDMSEYLRLSITASVPGNAVIKVYLKNGEKYLVHFEVSEEFNPVTTVPSAESPADEKKTSGELSEGITWKLDDKGTLTISGSGDVPDYFENLYLVNPLCKNNDILNVVIENGITAIGDNLFWDCPNLKSVSLPKTVKKIGNEAFKACSSLSNISFPEGLEYIGKRAFEGCSSLEKIFFPETMEKIDEKAFYNCTNLRTVSIYSKNINVMDYALGYQKSDYELVDGFKIKGYPLKGGHLYASANLILFEAISGSLGNGISYFIDDSATLTISGEGKIPDYYEGTSPFSDRKDIRSVVFEEGITGIGNFLFSENRYIESVKFADSIEYIGESSFSRCFTLQSVTLPKNVKSIGRGAFQWCNVLESVTLNEGLEKICGYAFSSCSRLKYVTIPDSVKEAEEMLFSKCDSLTEVSVPETLGKITGLPENTKLTVRKSGNNSETAVTTAVTQFTSAPVTTTVTHLSSVSSSTTVTYLPSASVTTMATYLSSAPVTTNTVTQPVEAAVTTAPVPVPDIPVVYAVKDADGNGVMNIFDYVHVIKMIIGGYTDKTADVNSDGVVDSMDVVLIRKVLMK